VSNYYNGDDDDNDIPLEDNDYYSYEKNSAFSVMYVSQYVHFHADMLYYLSLRHISMGEYHDRTIDSITFF
jgi:hypothetical protein